jgi:predicted RNA-binding protein with PIN domain
MLYLIDGYNLLFSGAGRRPRDEREMEAARGELVRLLQRLHAARRGRSILVFDCRKPFFLFGLPRRSRAGDVEIRFAASDSSADDLLREMIREARDAQGTTVVTSDREILDDADARGIRSVGAKAFWAVLQEGGAAEEGRQAGKAAGARPAARGTRGAPPAPPEPDAKRQGLTGSEVDYWMKEFGMTGNEGEIELGGEPKED